jgi:hypothetical protein
MMSLEIATPKGRAGMRGFSIAVYYKAETKNGKVIA